MGLTADPRYVDLAKDFPCPTCLTPRGRKCQTKLELPNGAKLWVLIPGSVHTERASLAKLPLTDPEGEVWDE